MDKRIFPPPTKVKSKIWENFGFYAKPDSQTLDMSHAICKNCKIKVKYSGNTTNLSLHMSRHHPDQPALVAAGRPSSSTYLSSQKQPTMPDAFISKLLPSSQRSQKITNALMRFICQDLRPYSVVENNGFRQLLHECEPRYTIPTRQFLTETAIPRLYDEVKRDVLLSLSSAQRVSVSCDAWTSRATQSYVTITCHYISPQWELVSHVLQTRVMFENHTGANIADLLNDVMHEWGIKDKDPVLVTDSASNMAVAAELAKLVHVRCFAHCLNLAAQRALKLPKVSRLLGRVRSITTFFRKSTIACHVLHEKQKVLGLPEHKLMTDVCTRWNSAHDMLERFVEQQPAICAALLSTEVRKNAKDLWTLTEADITCAEDVIKVLKPLKLATHVMSEEKTPTVSIIAPLHAQLSHGTQIEATDSAVTREIKIAVTGDLEKRYDREMPLLNMTSALDPRFKELPFLKEENRQEVYTKMAMEASQISLATTYYESTQELQVTYKHPDPASQTEAVKRSARSRARRKRSVLAEDEVGLWKCATIDLMSDEEDGIVGGVSGWIVRPPSFRS
ncbi:Zinc finger BED domain-containing protein 1 [Anabarilius grahami]|uniref:Zinc finger BED domain-containing protein 1 n=1 Tax=Anabarilius grahami TaxID=495550 RepID=A0A3N0YR01_ANAGA|nr:Zinc finger BED domain-containing protein 1 [Anabarilius grahami]